MIRMTLRLTQGSTPPPLLRRLVCPSFHAGLFNSFQPDGLVVVVLSFFTSPIPLPLSLPQIAPYTTCLINGVFWAPGTPRLITKEQCKALHPQYYDPVHHLTTVSVPKLPQRLLAIADISCDMHVWLLVLFFVCLFFNSLFLPPPPDAGVSRVHDSLYNNRSTIHSLQCTHRRFHIRVSEYFYCTTTVLVE